MIHIRIGRNKFAFISKIFLFIIVASLFISCKAEESQIFKDEILSYVEFKDKQMMVEEEKEEEKVLKEFDDSDISFKRQLRIKNIDLKDRKITAKLNNGKTWQSPDNYDIQNFLFFDIDNDKENELVLLAWRKGKYGKSMPFWEKENDMSWSQHIFIYDFLNGTFKPIWMSSYVSILIKDFSNEEYNLLKILGYDGSRTKWKWTGFGIDFISNYKFDFDETLDSINGKVKINAFGDNLIHSSIYKYAMAKNINYDFLYKNILKENEEADISILNHETMLVKDPLLYGTYPKFGTPIGVGEAIIKAGFDVVTIANNHSLDKEMEGINDTYNFYEENNVKCLGLNNYKDIKKPYIIVNKNNIDIAMFNYTYSSCYEKSVEEKYPYINLLNDEKEIRKNLYEARKKSDVVIVFVHWGDDYKTEISDFQKQYAKIFLEEGVDIVVGTHPHVLQKKEILNDNNGKEMLIYYSLGNFVSAQNYIETMLGGEAKFTIYNTDHGIKISDIKLEAIVTHQEKGLVTAYIFKDYSEELAEKHRLKYKNGKEFINKLQNIYEKICSQK